MSVRRYVLTLVVLGGCGFPRPPLIEGLGEGDFAMELANARIRVVEGASTTVGVKLVRSGLMAPVTVTVTGLPTGVTADPLTVDAEVGTLTLHATADAVQGDAALTVTATTDGLSHDAALSLLTMGLPGTLDQSFGSGGVIAVLPAGRAEALAIQPDGKIVIAGPSGTNSLTYAVMRYLANGDLDTSFSTGTVLLDAYLPGSTAIALQPDGKIIVAETYGHRSTEGRIVRVNTDGQLDMSFGDSGRVVLRLHDASAPPFSSTVLSAVIARPDGSIVVAGTTDIFENNTTISSGVLAQLTPQGMLDSNFGTSGRSFTSTRGFSPTLTVGSPTIFDVLIDSDGRLLYSGVAVSGTNENTTRTMVFARHDPKGVEDQSFGDHGEFFLFGLDSRSGSMVLHPNGRLYASAGPKNGHAILVRLDATLGYPDIDFGERGLKTTELTVGPETLSRLTEQRDGKLLMAGTASTGTALAAYVARFNIDGQLDATFGGGLTTVTFPAGNTYFRAVALDNEGRIVAAGYRDGPPDRVLLCRFWP